MRASTTRERSRWTRPRSPRGQAMAEYGILNLVLVVALIIFTTARLAPSGAGPRNAIELMMLAFQNYLDSYYFLLSLPIP